VATKRVQARENTVLAEPLDPAQTCVASLLAAHPRTIREDAPIEGAVRMMRAGKFRRLPVINSGNKLVGPVSLDDILAQLIEEFREVGRLLQEERPRDLVT